MNSVLEKITHIIPDKTYLKIKYRQRMGVKLNLKKPQTFSEKLQWLKLYDRNPDYSKMVDKYEVKKYVSEVIGNEFVIPNLGVWDSFDDIDFDGLPDQFVLKCTHDSGGLVICRDKSSIDHKNARNKIQKSFSRQYFWHGREWPYKSIKPRIIAEKYMEDENAQELVDYKFYCFNGTPRFLYVSQGLENHSTARISYVSLEWENMPFIRPDYKPFDELPLKPRNFDLMIKIATELSANIPFLRVDLYEVNGKVYFGELTFFPGIGMNKFEPEEWDRRIGEWLELPERKRSNE